MSPELQQAIADVNAAAARHARAKPEDRIKRWNEFVQAMDLIVKIWTAL